MFHGAVSIRFYVFQPHWEPLQIALPRLKYFTELRNLKHFILKSSWNWPDFLVTLRVYCAWELTSAELLFSKSQNDKAGHKGQKPSHIMLNASCKNSSANHHANPHAKKRLYGQLEILAIDDFQGLRPLWQSVKYSVNIKCCTYNTQLHQNGFVCWGVKALVPWVTALFQQPLSAWCKYDGSQTQNITDFQAWSKNSKDTVLYTENMLSQKLRIIVQYQLFTKYHFPDAKPVHLPLLGKQPFWKLPILQIIL